MTEPRWVTRELVEYMHDCVLELAGGARGLRDGDKHTAFFVASDFLDQNGYELQAAVDQEHADMMVELAQGKMTRADAAVYLRTYSIKTSAT